MNKLASNKEKFIQRVKNFDFEVALTKLVPCNSPSDEYFREVISYLVSKNFKSELDFFSNCKKHSSIDEDEMYKIKELIRRQKKCTDLPVTYLLSILLSKYPSKKNSNEWTFLGCLLLILLLNTQYNADSDSPDSNNTKKKKTRIQETCPHIRISLENTSSKYIIEFLINEHKKVKNLADLFNLYNKIKNFNNNISHTQINNTRISAIRLLYRDATKNLSKGTKHFQSRTKTNIQKNIGEGLLETQFFEQNNKHKSQAIEDALDGSVYSLIKPANNDNFNSFEDNNQRFKKKIRSVFRNEFNFLTNDKILLKASYQKIVEFLYQSIKKAEQSKIADESMYDAVLLTSMLTGRSITDIVNEIFAKKATWLFITAKNVKVISKIRVTSVKLKKEKYRKARFRREGDSNQFEIILPQIVFKQLSNLKARKHKENESAINDFLKTRLQDVKKQLKFPKLSSQHLTNCILSIFYNELKKPLIGQYLRGSNVENNTPMTYLTISEKDLSKNYIDFLDVLSQRLCTCDLNSFKSTMLSKIDTLGKEDNIGSSMPLKIEQCRRFLMLLGRMLSKKII